MVPHASVVEVDWKGEEGWGIPERRKVDQCFEYIYGEISYDKLRRRSDTLLCGFAKSSD
jgi:hypothetical protein